MYDHIAKVELCGSFIYIGDVFILDVDKILRINKLDYTGEAVDVCGTQFCVVIYLSDTVNEVIPFIKEHDRDIFFERIKTILSIYSYRS